MLSEQSARIGSEKKPSDLFGVGTREHTPPPGHYRVASAFENNSGKRKVAWALRAATRQ